MTKKLEQSAREVIRQHSMECLSDKTVDALREALAEQVHTPYCKQAPMCKTPCGNSDCVEQAEQEPVGMLRMGAKQDFVTTKAAEELSSGHDEWHPVYAAPVRTKDLTVSELDAIIEKHYDDEMDLKAMILDGIAADRKKNRG